MQQQDRKWSDTELIYLKEQYLLNVNPSIIAEKLFRNKKSVINKANLLGISNSTEYSEEEKNEIINAYKNANNINFLEDLSLKLNRPKENLSRFARRLGLTDSSNRKKINIANNVHTKICIVCNNEFTTDGYSRNTICSKKCISNNVSNKIKKHFETNGHPKGMLGKKHSEETIKNFSIIQTELAKKVTIEQRAIITMKTLKTKEKNGTLITPRHKTTWKQGWRNIGGINKYYRSRWEANYARILEFHKKNGIIKHWEHEPQTFWFENVKRGTRSYLPDFKIYNNNGTIEWHEVKGWFDDKSKTKLKRMAKYYPNENIVLKDSNWFKTNSKKYKQLIIDWE